MPSRSSSNECIIMISVLAQKQLAEEIPGKRNLGLISEETSLFRQKFQGFHLSDSEGKLYVLGLRDIIFKSVQHILSTIKHIIFVDDPDHNGLCFFVTLLMSFGGHSPLLMWFRNINETSTKLCEWLAVFLEDSSTELIIYKPNVHLSDVYLCNF